MTEREDQVVEAEFVAARPLSEDEQALVEEINELRKASLGNVKDAFRQLLTLATAIFGLQLTVLELSETKLSIPLSWREAAVVGSTVCLFAVTAISAFGQLSRAIRLPTIGMLDEYRRLRDRTLRRSSWLYITASSLFLLGLALFAVSFVVLFG